MRILHNARTTTRALIVSVVGTWLAAGVLAWVLPPLLVVQPALVEGTAEVTTVLGIFAVVVAAVAALELLGLAITWRAPQSAVGRVVLLASGILMTVLGLFLLNGGALQSPEIQWSAVPASVGAIVVAVFAAAGLLACAAALFSELPGASIAERMTVQGEVTMGAPRHELLLVLTGALVVAWIWTMATVLRTHSAEPFDVMQFLMPVLAGALAAGWRAGKPNRLATLGLASAAGAASCWLFLAGVMLGHYYQFNPVGYVFWWGLFGAIFGAIGYGGWLLGRRLVRMASRRSLNTGHSHA
jgi:hypothetical protein